MEVVQKSISEIKPYEKNPRKNDDAATKKWKLSERELEIVHKLGNCS